MSTIMARDDRTQLLQSTLDMLILRTLLFGPLHGRAIATHIQRTTDDVLQVEQGSLYPALHRLERQGLIAGNWEANESGRDLKFYKLTSAGRKQLAQEASNWRRFTAAI